MHEQEIKKKISEIELILNELNFGGHTEREFLFKVDRCNNLIDKLFLEVEACKNSFDKQISEKIKNAKGLRMRLNEIVNKNDEISKKTLLERIYYLAMINLGLVPVLSFLGFFALFFYMREVGLGRLFYDIASEAKSLIFFFSIGMVIFLLFFSLPVFFTYLEIDKVKNQDKKVVVNNNNLLRIAEAISQNKIMNRLAYWAKTLLIFLSAFGGFLVFTDTIPAFWGAAGWVLLMALIKELFVRAAKSKDYKTTRSLFGWMLFFLIAYLFLFVQIVNITGNSIRFSRIFYMVGFSEPSSWQKLSQDYLDRSGFVENDINRLKATFSHPEKDFPNDFSVGSVYLYGAIVAKTSSMKILCTAHGKDLICQEFMNGDLIPVRWLKDNQEK